MSPPAHPRGPEPAAGRLEIVHRAVHTIRHKSGRMAAGCSFHNRISGAVKQPPQPGQRLTQAARGCPQPERAFRSRGQKTARIGRIFFIFFFLLVLFFFFSFSPVKVAKNHAASEGRGKGKNRARQEEKESIVFVRFSGHFFISFSSLSGIPLKGNYSASLFLSTSFLPLFSFHFFSYSFLSLFPPLSTLTLFSDSVPCLKEKHNKKKISPRIFLFFSRFLISYFDPIYRQDEH